MKIVFQVHEHFSIFQEFIKFKKFCKTSTIFIIQKSFKINEKNNDPFFFEDSRGGAEMSEKENRLNDLA